MAPTPCIGLYGFCYLSIIIPFSIVNVYSPNDAVERPQLWHWLTNSLPPSWVVCGDFNMVGLAYDKDGILPFWWTTGERKTWYYMRNKSGPFDPNSHPHHSSGIWHTWSNFRVGSYRIFKRLDHVMISIQSFFSFFSEDWELLVIPLYDVIFSNHYPIILTNLANNSNTSF